MNIVYIDGYKNRNGAGYLVCDSESNVLSKEKIGRNKTNNEAEYYGALKGLELVDNKGIVYTDSKLVEGHVMKNWKVKAFHLRQLVDGCKGIIKRKKAQIVWIPRAKNLAGVLIENESEIQAGLYLKFSEKFELYVKQNFPNEWDLFLNNVNDLKDKLDFFTQAYKV